MTERVSVVIPNWNGRKFLRTCLDSLRQQTFPDFVTYVVDNGSQDGSVEFLRECYPEVRIVALDRNVGFAAGMNAGIAKAEGEYIAALNNDTETHPAWLAELVSALDSRPDIGFCASKILDFSDRKIIDSIGHGYTRAGVSVKIGSGERDLGQYDAMLPVFGASAAAAMYRRSMLDRIGLYDEDFFAYMEDVDLDIRARLAGYRCVSVPTAVVYHIGSATTGGGTSEFSLRMTTKNIYAIIAKDIPGLLLPQVLFLTVMAQIWVVCLCVVSDRHQGIRRNLRGYFRGLAAALRQLPMMLRKRSQVQQLRQIGTREFAAAMRACESRRFGFG